jgi:hypothetical protein
MDVSKVHPQMTAGLDLGDKYSYLCLLDQHSGEVIEEGRLRTSPEAFRRRFSSEQPMRIAIEAGWTCVGSVDCLRLRTVRGKENIATNKPDLPTGVSPRSYPAG